jgi:hypothetical protein
VEWSGSTTTNVTKPVCWAVFTVADLARPKIETQLICINNMTFTQPEWLVNAAVAVQPILVWPTLEGKHCDKRHPASVLGCGDSR